MIENQDIDKSYTIYGPSTFENAFENYTLIKVRDTGFVVIKSVISIDDAKPFSLDSSTEGYESHSLDSSLNSFDIKDQIEAFEKELKKGRRLPGLPYEDDNRGY